MSPESQAIVKTNDLPIRHEGDVHDGKVRSVYWLSQEDSGSVARIIELRKSQSPLGVMVISDRISAFECKWQTESGLKGVPGKGAALNAISQYWFNKFESEGLAGNHILASPHPLVWIVQKAEPILVEAIARQYITGSLWRDYHEKGVREFCGIPLPEGLKKDQRLDELLITPTTKGIIRGVPGIPEKDDVNLSRQQILDNYQAFGFKTKDDVAVYERLLSAGFAIMSRELAAIGKILADDKREFGYFYGNDGRPVMVHMDEVGTPDSSRYWDSESYQRGETVEESKEKFRQELLGNVPDRDVLLNKNRMGERTELAKNYRVPDRVFMETSNLYRKLAEQITGKPLPQIKNARAEILEALRPYGIIQEAA